MNYFTIIVTLLLAGWWTQLSSGSAGVQTRDDNWQANCSDVDKDDYCPESCSDCYTLKVDNIPQYQATCKPNRDGMIPQGTRPHCLTHLDLIIYLPPIMQNIFAGSKFQNFTGLIALNIVLTTLNSVILSEDSFMGLQHIHTLLLQFYTFYDYGFKFKTLFNENVFQPLILMKSLTVTFAQDLHDSVIVKESVLPNLNSLTTQTHVWKNVSVLGLYAPHLRIVQIQQSRVHHLSHKRFNADALSNLRHTQVQTLNVSSCNIGHFDGNALKSTRNLTTIDISDNPLAEKELLNFVTGLKYTQVKYIYMNNLERKTVYMWGNFGFYLPASKLGQQIVNGTCTINNQIIFGYGPKIFSILRKLLIEYATCYDKDIFRMARHEDHLMPPSRLCSQPLANVNLAHSKIHLEHNAIYHVTLMNGLKRLNVTNLSIIGKLASNNTLNIHCTNVISHLDVLDMNKVQLVYMAKINVLHRNCSFPFLKCLKIAHSTFGDFLSKQKNVNLFNTMTQLEDLDLTNTGVGDNVLTTNIFRSHRQIVNLKLGRNNITHFSPSLIHMRNLEYLDLSYNNLHKLTQWTMIVLDRIQRNSNLTLNLTGNPTFSCNCESRFFISWLMTTKVHIINKDHLQCAVDSHIYPLTQNNLLIIIDQLKHMCLPMAWLTYPTGFTGFMLSAMTLISVAFRFRYIIQYLWLNLRMRAKQNLNVGRQYKYDAFICYNMADYQWVRHQLFKNLEEDTKEFKLCFHHRDFLVGEFIVDNIIDALQQSRCAILVVSENSVTSKWWELELNMAHQMSLERQHNMIICVFMGEISAKKLPPIIGRILKLFTCLKWPESEDAKKLFWVKLRKALGNTDDPICEKPK